MKEITICSPQLGISPETNSGGEVYDREVLRTLALKGSKVYCLLPKNRDYPKVKNLYIKQALITHMFPPYIYNFFVFPYLINLYKEKQFNILRVHSPYFVGPAALFFKRFYPQIPVVASYLHLEDTSIFQPFLDKVLIHKFDHIITISQFTKQEIKKRFLVPAGKITVAYPGVDKKFKPQIKNKMLIKKFNLAGKQVLLFLGGLKPRKNPLFLLDILSKISNQNVILIVAGSGSLERKMIEKSKSLKLNNRVFFTGFVSENKKVDYYSLADIVLLPSIKEGFGMIAAEAAACRKVIVASNNSSLPEIIVDGKTGFLAKSSDLHEWLIKINRLLLDKNLIKKISFQAEKYVKKKFSWQENARIHLEVFNYLIKKNESTLC